MIEFKTTEGETHTLVEIIIAGDDPLAPSVLQELVAPRVNGSKGVVISGRAPIWLYGFLVHEYHPTAWMATYDPRLNGAVVVERHTPSAPSLGSIISPTPRTN